MSTCEHGIPVSEDCAQCRAILSAEAAAFARSHERYLQLVDNYMASSTQNIQLAIENTRLLNIIKGCPVCSELEWNGRVNR